MTVTSQGWEMIRIVTALVALATLAVVLRIVARLKRRLDFGLDDYLCFAALLLLYGMFIELMLWCCIGGIGVHLADIDPNTLKNFFKIFLSNQFVYFVLCPVIKISIVCFYRRIFSVPYFNNFSIALSCLMAAWAAGIFFACAGQCRPLSAYWDKSIPGHCFDPVLFFIVNQIFNIVMDFILLLIPIPIIWRLHRAWQEKLELTAVFAVGGFVCFASIYRVIVLYRIDPADTTYTTFQACLWTHVEPSVGLICSCLPTIRGLLPRLSRPAQTTIPTRTWASSVRKSGLYNSRMSRMSGIPESKKLETTASALPFMVTRADSDFVTLTDVTADPPKSVDSRSLEEGGGGLTNNSKDPSGQIHGSAGRTGGMLDITVRTDINVIKDNDSRRRESNSD